MMDDNGNLIYFVAGFIVGIIFSGVVNWIYEHVQIIW